MQEPIIDPTRLFFVTVQEAGRTGFLLGPYEKHEDALTNVNRGKDLACAHNDRACWYAYGTSSLPRETASQIKTVFGA